jgi:hypothetical protein
MCYVKALAGGYSHNKGMCEVELRQPFILRMASPKGFTMCKTQLLNILNLKSSIVESGNFHGYKVLFEYTVK